MSHRKPGGRERPVPSAGLKHADGSNSSVGGLPGTQGPSVCTTFLEGAVPTSDTRLSHAASRRPSRCTLPGLLGESVTRTAQGRAEVLTRGQEMTTGSMRPAGRHWERRPASQEVKVQSATTGISEIGSSGRPPRLRDFGLVFSRNYPLSFLL